VRERWARIRIRRIYIHIERGAFWRVVLIIFHIVVRVVIRQIEVQIIIVLFVFVVLILSQIGQGTRRENRPRRSYRWRGGLGGGHGRRISGAGRFGFWRAKWTAFEGARR